MGRRRRAREDALQMLYAIDLSGSSVHEVVEDFRRERKRLDRLTEYLVYETMRMRDEIDQLLTVHMEHWNVERLSAIDRNILRLGLAEIICCPDVPTKVTINEYIEIGKKYGDLDSPKFINGVIDKAARDQEIISTLKRLPMKPPPPDTD